MSEQMNRFFEGLQSLISVKEVEIQNTIFKRLLALPDDPVPSLGVIEAASDPCTFSNGKHTTIIGTPSISDGAGRNSPSRCLCRCGRFYIVSNEAYNHYNYQPTRNEEQSYFDEMKSEPGKHPHLIERLELFAILPYYIIDLLKQRYLDVGGAYRHAQQPPPSNAYKGMNEVAKFYAERHASRLLALQLNLELSAKNSLLESDLEQNTNLEKNMRAQVNNLEEENFKLRALVDENQAKSSQIREEEKIKFDSRIIELQQAMQDLNGTLFGHWVLPLF